jgi:hypothetical protein
VVLARGAVNRRDEHEEEQLLPDRVCTGTAMVFKEFSDEDIGTRVGFSGGVKFADKAERGRKAGQDVR